MLINNTEARIHVITVPAGEGVDGYQKIRLMPGFNRVDQRLWDLALQNKIVQYHVKSGALIGYVAELEDLVDGDVVDVISNTFDLDLLRYWLTEDKRGNVQRLLYSQIDRFEKGADQWQSLGPTF